MTKLEESAKAEVASQDQIKATALASKKTELGNFAATIKKVRERGARQMKKLRTDRANELVEKRGVADAVTAMKARFAAKMAANNKERDMKIEECKATTETSVRPSKVT